ncbi:MAG: M23 family metallopeptidase [Opitutaceae bacterium]|nr:M23 family metallopeptidase [Opitutaceae bacterium]
MRRLTVSVLVLLTAIVAPARDRLELIWPTPNQAWAEGRSLETFIQPTVSGEPPSGCFGCVRSDGFQFHEGIDIKPVARDRRGEPADRIFAVMAGVVRHVNLRPGESSYGRYIVIEHPGAAPAVYTLYAHLASVMPRIAPGVQVERGQVIAVMGHSAGGYAIPRDRAHLHFEIGVMATRDFQSWYNWKKFGSPNQHGRWNGMNLMGLDPLDFYNQWRDHRVDNFQDYFEQMRPQVRLRIATRRIPDFVQRYPGLLLAPLPVGPIGGWEIAFDWTGLPFAWRPLLPAEVMGLAVNHVSIVEVDRTSVVRHRAKVLVRPRGSGYVPGRDLDLVLQQLFGLR